MITFRNGPAKGVTLMVRRAPLLVRVVKGKEWDALDGYGDTPQPEETIHVYRRVTGVTRVHLLTPKRAGSGWFERAEYVHSAAQPEDATARSMITWRQWCMDHRDG